MKRKSLCAFLLIFWLFGVCTLLSAWVEDLMTPQAVVVRPEYQKGTGGSVIPKDCLFYGETGSTLYVTYEGTGWEAGIRAEISTEMYQETKRGLEMSMGNDEYIEYVSKPIQPGDKIKKIKNTRKVPDHWLAMLPKDAPKPEAAGEGISLEQESGRNLLISVENCVQPFMENQAQKLLFKGETQLPADLKIYSMNDTESLLSALPLLAVLLVSLLVPLILWAYSCRLAKSPRKNKKALLVNGGIAAACFAALPFLLNVIKLPSSLLPQDNIFDFGHYSHEFSQIFAALKTFAAQGSQTAAAALSRAQTALWASLAVVLSGTALGVVIVVIGTHICRKKPTEK